jgi:hypothetical protein
MLYSCLWAAKTQPSSSRHNLLDPFPQPNQPTYRPYRLQLIQNIQNLPSHLYLDYPLSQYLLPPHQAKTSPLTLYSDPPCPTLLFPIIFSNPPNLSPLSGGPHLAIRKYRTRKTYHPIQSRRISACSPAKKGIYNIHYAQVCVCIATSQPYRAYSKPESDELTT